MTAKWNLIVDVAKCDNCRNCFLAAKDEHIGNDFPGYAAAQPPEVHAWVDIVPKERGRWPVVEAHFMPVMCNHCDDAPCMKAAKNDAVKKREDGIVIIDPVKSKGQKQIVDACPYGAIWWNEEKQIPQAWIFDAHLIDSGWTKPRVEQSCPTAVFRSMKIEDSEMQRIAAAEDLKILKPELNSKPRVYYKNLHLFTTCFLAGSVAADIKGVEECAEGATVVVKRNGAEVARATADTFGEFKIDKLAPRSGRHDVEISLGAQKLSTSFDLADESVYLGVLKLRA